MPDASLVLSGLKWVSLALGAASAVWGLVGRKPTVEDEHGRKRLTPAGMVTLAMMIGAALIGAISFGFETLVKQQEAVAGELKARRAAEEQRVRDDRARATQANTRAIRAEQRAAIAEQRATVANQRATVIALASEARLRDLALSQQVGAGASRNLARTEQALTQIERVLQPLEPITVRITWEIPPDAPGVAIATRRMAAHVRAFDAAALRDWRAVAGRHSLPPEPTQIMSFAPGEDTYPDPARPAERGLFANVRSPRSILSFFVENTPEAAAIARLCAASSGLAEVGDLRLTIAGAAQPAIDYVVATGAVRFTVEATIAPEQMARTGAIVSIPDLQRALPLLDVNVRGQAPDLRPLMRPVAMWVESPSRSYAIAIGEARHVTTCVFRPIFSLPRFTVAKPK